MRDLKFRQLTAEEVECRVGTLINKDGFSLLLYKDARCDQNILDETVGALNWQRDHKEVKGNMFCGVSIWDEDRKQWVTKWDCGVESNTEKEKGEASDSFKRACFNWGIGRELYTAPFIWVSGNTRLNSKEKYVPTFKSIKVVRLEYNDGHISELTISGDGEVIFEWGVRRSQIAKTAVEQAKTQQSAPSFEKMTLEKAILFRTTKGSLYGDLTDDQLQYIIKNSRSKDNIEAAKIILDDRQNCIDLQPIDDSQLPF